MAKWDPAIYTGPVTATPHRSTEERVAAMLAQYPGRAGSMPIERRAHAARRLLTLSGVEVHAAAMGAKFRSYVQPDQKHFVGLLLVAQGRSLAYITSYLDCDNRSVYRWIQRAQEHTQNQESTDGQGKPSEAATGAAGIHARGPEQGQ